MKFLLTLISASGLFTAAASAVVSFANLDHIANTDPTYLASLNNYAAESGRIGYVNFLGTRDLDGEQFVVTIFFSIDTTLSTVTSGDPGIPSTTENSWVPGVFGIYIVDTQTSLQVSNYLTGNAAGFQVLFSEVDQNTAPTGIYQDNLQAYTPTGAFFGFVDENVPQSGVDSTGIIDTSGTGPKTLATTGFPWVITDTNTEFRYATSGNPTVYYGDTAIHGNIIDSSGILIPEPSALFLLGGASILGLQRRRRASI